MTNWIETRENLPPFHMEVLFYIRDEIEGYTEDYCTQGCVYENKETGAVNYTLRCGRELSEDEKVSYWTLLPSPPCPRMNK